MFFPSNTYQSVMSRFSKALANEKNESHYGKGNFFLTFSERKKKQSKHKYQGSRVPQKVLNLKSILLQFRATHVICTSWRGIASKQTVAKPHFGNPSIASQLINIVSSIIVTLINRNETKARKDELLVMKKPYNYIINQLSSYRLFILIGVKKSNLEVKTW